MTTEHTGNLSQHPASSEGRVLKALKAEPKEIAALGQTEGALSNGPYPGNGVFEPMGFAQSDGEGGKNPSS